MALILGISLAVLFLPHPDLLKFLAQQSEPAHRLCLQATPTGSYKPFYDAIVCGASLEGPEAQAFRVTGLIHLMVVSGAHLIFLLELMARFSPRATRTHLAVLSLFVVVTGWQAPALRAFASIVLGLINCRFGLSWSSSQVTLASGVLLWALFPNLIISLSFLLSWAAALALSVGPKEPLARNATIFFFLFPILAPLSTPHPVSIFLNWIVGPAIGALLFPASLAATLFHPLRAIVDPLWIGLEALVTTLERELPPSKPSSPVPLWTLWLYLWLVHFWFFARSLWRRGRE